MTVDLACEAAAFGARVARLPAIDVARDVEAVARAAFAGRGGDGAAMLARALWLSRHDGDRRVALARDAARAQGLRVAELVLEGAPPLRALSFRARRPQPGPTSIDRVILRGPLSARFPTWLRTGLRERIVANYVHPNAEHTRRLLGEPSLVLCDVVAMCARRPTTAELLSEVAASARWIARAEVREALVWNPFTPASIAVRLLPTLASSRHARTAASLDPRLREAARLLAGEVPRGEP